MKKILTHLLLREINKGICNIVVTVVIHMSHIDGMVVEHIQKTSTPPLADNHHTMTLTAKQREGKKKEKKEKKRNKDKFKKSQNSKRLALTGEKSLL